MFSKAVVSGLILFFAGSTYAGDGAVSFSDSTAVLSQLNEKAQYILREGLKNGTVVRARLINLPLDELKHASNLNIEVFDHAVISLDVLHQDTITSPGMRKVRLEDRFGQTSNIIVTKKGMTAIIWNYPSVYKIIPLGGGKHLLMEIGTRTIPLESGHIPAQDNVKAPTQK